MAAKNKNDWLAVRKIARLRRSLGLLAQVTPVTWRGLSWTSWPLSPSLLEASGEAQEEEEGLRFLLREEVAVALFDDRRDLLLLLLLLLLLGVAAVIRAFVGGQRRREQDALSCGQFKQSIPTPEFEGSLVDNLEVLKGHVCRK